MTRRVVGWLMSRIRRVFWELPVAKKRKQKGRIGVKGDEAGEIGTGDG